jgi:hypothetical protein
MTTIDTPHTSTPARRRIVATAKLAFAAGAIAVGTMALTPAIASAEWDIGTYDGCEARTIGSSTPQDDICCSESGGRWNDKLGECVAPPEDESGDDGPPETSTGPTTNPMRVIRPQPPASMAPPASTVAIPTPVILHRGSFS